MRRFFIILTAFLGFSMLSEAQDLTPETIQRRLDRNEKSIEHSRRSENPKTWVDRGVIFQDIFDVNVQFLYFGMTEDEVIIFMKEPNERRTIETDTGVREVMVYNDIDLYFEGGQLVGWKEKNVLHENPLYEAYDAFQKSIELDERDKHERVLNNAFIRLHAQLVSKAVLDYEEGNIEDSYEAFKKSLEVSDSPYYVPPVDTGLVFNTGFVAALTGNHDEAIKYFERARDMNYNESNLYVLMKDAYVALGDSTSAEKILQEGFQKFPEDNTVLVELVNFYIMSQNAQEALEYLRLAKQQEPDNPSFHFAEGTLYEQIDESEKAVESYENAIEIDPDYFDANYNLGVVYYNKAVAMLEEANEIMDNKKFAEARDEAYEVLRDAIPYLEQAHVSNPSHQSTMETLRILYYRLGIEDKLEDMNTKLGRNTDQ